MTIIAIVPNDPTSRGRYLEQIQLPENYMEDFSVMGFVVDRFEEATTLLTVNKIQVFKQKIGAEISLASAKEIPTIGDLFAAHGIGWSYEDVADTLYQA